MIYAIVDKENIVVNVIVANESFKERLDEIFSESQVITSDRMKDSTTASIGFTYKDGYFVPHKSWTVTQDGKYQAKTAYPTDGKNYIWNEKTESWDLITTKTPAERDAEIKPIKPL